jgi:hypothetical protein
MEYANYLIEKEIQEQTKRSPSIPTEDTWEEQYAAYCAEKEAKLLAEDEQKRRTEAN